MFHKHELIFKAILAAEAASKAILKIYSEGSGKVYLKSDQSPLTDADLAANNEIISILSDTNIPLLSEEGKDIEYRLRSQWDLFWMVDPLDGTKEFISRNGEFTVNIALIEKNKPIGGVIWVPVKDTLYFALKGMGAYKKSGFQASHCHSLQDVMSLSEKISASTPQKTLKVVASRSHLNKETQDFISDLSNKFGKVELISCGSSLKFCTMAEGKAGIYPRFGPTMEWDTAAGHAIAEEAGCIVKHENGKDSFVYNKENLLNPAFVVWNKGYL
ncbi:MAG: 3'(2'),5'-bisphosphate nucleotidase [Bacteroidetes bacterium HGW-Bacteroidetes-21]|jgi:3'(2'), 5'-bisphosphate nucleotidase|nr:MAG: 3'(2'),5'-bisphosphate nucleotidase [Bacteroidetes bacterium HGW-Bacteroidetes-21]